jgi:hypothetical protein
MVEFGVLRTLWSEKQIRHQEDLIGFRMLMTSSIRQILTALLLSLSMMSSAQADWINLSGAETAPNIAEIYVLDDHVKLVLEVYIGDLMVFDDLVPDSWLKTLNVDRPAPAERLRHFASKTFQLLTESGDKLQASLKLAEPRLRKDRQSPFAGMINPFTRQRVPEPPADKRVLYAELVYPFKTKPQTLTIVPPLDATGRARATIGFIAYHKAVPIIDFRYLGARAHLTLDWHDPWYSKFDNPNLKRHHKDALMSFLYIEPYEVRHEILTRVQDMGQWLDLGLSGDQYIEVDELEPLKQRIGAFLLGKNPVRVDGESLKPILDRMNYVKVGLSGIQLMEQPERLEISTAIIGVIITYLTPGLPQKVSVDWELFTDQIQRVPATAIDPAGPMLSSLEPQHNVHTWTNFLKDYKLPTVQLVAVDDALRSMRLPLGSLLCLFALLPVIQQGRRRWRTRRSMRPPLILAMLLFVVGVGLYPFAGVSIAKPGRMTPTLTDADAKAILYSLLKNVYRAFDFRQEEDVYNKLAVSVSGELLADVYLQSRKSLLIQKAGGAQAKVKAVEVSDVAITKLPARSLAFACNTTWTALGSVGHWGHVHTRKNLYNAIVTIEPVDGAWKITALELLEEKRLDPTVQPAMAKPNNQQSRDD